MYVRTCKEFKSHAENGYAWVYKLGVEVRRDIYRCAPRGQEVARVCRAFSHAREIPFVEDRVARYGRYYDARETACESI